MEEKKEVTLYVIFQPLCCHYSAIHSTEKLKGVWDTFRLRSSDSNRTCGFTYVCVQVIHSLSLFILYILYSVNLFPSPLSFGPFLSNSLYLSLYFFQTVLSLSLSQVPSNWPSFKRFLIILLVAGLGFFLYQEALPRIPQVTFLKSAFNSGSVFRFSEQVSDLFYATATRMHARVGVYISI